MIRIAETVAKCIEGRTLKKIVLSKSENKAVDRAVAARLVPSIVATAFTTEKGAQMELSEEMEKIFGENNVDLSRRIVRTAELNRTVKNS